MNPTQLSDRLHAADSVPVGDVDALIAGAIRQGRRQRRRRERVLPVVVGVVALATAVGLAGILAVRDGRSSTPAATTTPTASPAGLTATDVLEVLRANVPADIQVEGSGSEDEAMATVVLRDARGPAWAQISLNDGSGDMAESCTRSGYCRVVRVGTQMFYEFSTRRKRDGAIHLGSWTYYQRPDGRRTYFGQNNIVSPDGPVTRPDLPLTRTEVRALLTAPQWDPLAPRCRPKANTFVC